MSERNGRTVPRAIHALWGSAIVLFLAWGCGSSAEEKLRAAKLAGSCSINSDCEGELVCAFGRCHIACTEDRDCPPTLRCVHGSEEGTFVCQLPEEVECTDARDCPGKQVCGVDDECRDACDADGDCTKTQICANSNECASTVNGRDHIDNEGNIITGGGGSAGSNGSGGSGGDGTGQGGASGTGGSVAGNAGDRGDGGEGGVPGSGGTAIGGQGASSNGGSAGAQGGTSGSGGSGGMSGAGGNAAGASGSAGTGGAPVEVLTETPDGVETIDNNTRETALPITLPALATIYVAPTATGDQDWFSITVPNDGRAHVITIVMAQEVGAHVGIQAVTRELYFPIQYSASTVGATFHAYATAGPGATLLFRFWCASNTGGQGLVHLSFTETAENDDHEPNNTKDTAALIALATTYSAQMLNPWVSNLDRPNEDWFAVELAAGEATVTLTDVPSVGRMEVSRVAPSGESTRLGITTEDTTGSFPSFTVTTPGVHYLQFVPYADISGYSAGDKPAYLTEQYSFRVTQP